MFSTFSERLKELRTEKELSANKLASLVGLNHTSILDWEKDRQVPLLTNAITLAQFFGVTLDYIAGITEC